MFIKQIISPSDIMSINPFNIIIDHLIYKPFVLLYRLFGEEAHITRSEVRHYL